MSVSGNGTGVSVIPKKRGIGRPFKKGCAPGPGRPKGQRDQSTIIGERIKREILAVWDSIDGPRLLANWAQENFSEFMRVVLQLIPREDIIAVQPVDNGAGLKLIFNKAQDVLAGDDDDHLLDATATADGDKGRTPTP